MNGGDAAGGRPIRVAAIDCGTNSIRLLVADVARESGGRPRLADVHREMRVVRLGQGVDATGRLSSHALDRTWRALADYAAIIGASGAVRTRMVATSATRDAQNRADFIEMVRSTLGQDPEVISGDEEAELTFAGAVGDLDPVTGPFLVVDIGGGSTELVIGRRDGATNDLAGGISLDIGCVRITERILRSDPPTPAERDEARRWAARILAGGLDRLPVHLVRRLVPVSGTSTTVAAAALRLPIYDPARIHLARIPVERVSAVTETLLAATRAHRAALGYMHPGRVDVIGGGALILSTVVSLVAERIRAPLAEITVSEHDILDGIALSVG
jgi:exopolyphosphatase/guanosine-5'-triphosphate,3'-diphosphate pyrophosphatase